FRHVPPDHPPDVDPHLVLLGTSCAHTRAPPPTRPAARGRPGFVPRPAGWGWASGVTPTPPQSRRMVSTPPDPLKATSAPPPRVGSASNTNCWPWACTFAGFVPWVAATNCVPSDRAATSCTLVHGPVPLLVTRISYTASLPTSTGLSSPATSNRTAAIPSAE